MKKHGKIKIIILALVVVLILAYFLLPVKAIPKDYSSVIVQLVEINGHEVVITENQSEQILEVLKRYTVHGTLKRADREVHVPEIYIVLSFNNTNGVVFNTRGINLSSEHQYVSTGSIPFMYKSVYNGESMYEEIRDILLPGD